MKLYEAKVDLAGNPSNQTIVTDVTATEIAILNHIHGDMSVNVLKITGEVATDEEKKAALEECFAKYNRAKNDGRVIAQSLFGFNGHPTRVEDIGMEVAQVVPSNQADRAEIEAAVNGGPSPIDPDELDAFDA